MKRMKFLTLLFALLAWGSNAVADNVVTTNTPRIVPGGTTELVVSLECDQDFQIFAYDFRLKLPEGIEVEKTDAGYVYELKPRNANHNSFVDMDAGGNILFGINHPTIPLTGYQGEVLGITLKASATLPEGTYTGEIISIAYADDSDPVVIKYPANMQFSIVVSNTVELDENSTTVPAAATGVNALVKRSINANEWSTICLPFAMSAEQMTEAFGSDVKLCDFTGYDYDENADGDITKITVNFTTASAIEANHPYIIKVTSPVTEFTVENVDIAPEESPTVAAVKRSRKQWSEMIGTYVAQTTVDNNMLFLSGGKFYYSRGLTKMKGFRAYFDFYDVLTSVENSGSGAKIGFAIDNETTDIDGLFDDSQLREGWYTLDGKKLAGEPKQKGVYIHNGKKVKK